MGHHIDLCIDCQRVVGQCRCPAPDKPQRFVICPACQRKREEIGTCGRIAPEQEKEGAS